MMNMIGSMRADELMTQATAVTAADSVSKAIGILKRSKSYEILVVRKDRVEGLVSIRDILKARNIAGMRISSLITHVPQITAQDSVSLAAGIMTDHRIRTVPVVEKGKLVGQLTASSICERMSKQPKLNMNAAEIMTSQLVSLQEADTLAKARSLMIEKSIDHLPVLREREIAGIITSDAIVFRMSPPERISRKSIVSEERRQLDLQVRGLMAPDPVTCEPNTDVQEVIKAMNSRQTTYSLVSLWGELQ